MFCVSNFAFAKGPGSASANFLKMGVGGRGVAMGDAQTAAADDGLALYWNPAALGHQNMNEVNFMHSTYFQGVKQDVLAYTQPTLAYGAFGAGLSMLSVQDIVGYDDVGARKGNVAAKDTLITLGWGKAWTDFFLAPGLQTGINLKSLNKQLGGDSAGTMLLDLGLLYQVKNGSLERTRFGLVMQNLGGGLNFVSSKDPVPQPIKFGVSYPFFGNSLVTSLDYVMPSDGKATFNLGLDYRLLNLLAFRMGYKGQNDLNNGLTYGVSLGNQRLHLDYAFVPMGDLGDTHRVSVGFRFGRTYRETQVQSQILQAFERAEARYAQGYLVDAFMQASAIVDVAAWHRPSKLLMRRIQQEFQDMEDVSRREQLQMQIDEHFSRGEQHFQLDELLPARREFEAVQALNPGHTGATTYLSRIDERFRSIVQNFYETAMRYFAAGDYKQAKEYFEKVIVVDPNHVEAREQLARTEKLLGEAEKAEEERQRMETIRPVYMSALTAFQNKQYTVALDKFEEMLQLDSENAEARRYRLLCRELLAKEAYDIGNEAARKGEWVAAADSYKRSLKYKPNYPEAQGAYDKVKSNMGEQQKTESQLIYKRGLEVFLTGDHDKARQMWYEALALDPDNLEAKRGIERVTRSPQQ